MEGTSGDIKEFEVTGEVLQQFIAFFYNSDYKAASLDERVSVIAKSGLQEHSIVMSLKV